VGGQITATFDIPGANQAGFSAATGIVGPNFQFDAANVIGGLPAGEWTTTEGTWSLAGHTGGHVWLYTFCEPPGGTCAAGASNDWFWSTYWMKQAIFVLSNTTQPSASGFAGALTSSGAVAGTQNLVFQATDGASGVYRVTAAIGGKLIYSATPNVNGGECVPVGTYGGALEFSSAMPCPKSQSVTIPANTAAVSDGSHELTISVVDAAGNEATVYSKQIETHNAPSVTTPPNVAGVAVVGSTLTGTNGAFQAPSGAGALSAVKGQWMRCSDAAATRCAPIALATNTTYAPQAADVGYYLIYANTVSDNDGTTTSNSEPTTIVTAAATTTSCVAGECLHGGVGGSGPGSGITIAITGPGTGASSAPLGSKAKWGVTFKASPRLIHKGNTVYLKGAVTTTPRPAAGKLIFLQARAVEGEWRQGAHKRYWIPIPGEWITFDHLTSKPDGTWHATHYFKFGGRHIYEMQAVAPQEGGYLNATGTSRIVKIYER
jgi:hypothetical protein